MLKKTYGKDWFPHDKVALSKEGLVDLEEIEKDEIHKDWRSDSLECSTGKELVEIVCFLRGHTKLGNLKWREITAPQETIVRSCENEEHIFEAENFGCFFRLTYKDYGQRFMVLQSFTIKNNANMDEIIFLDTDNILDREYPSGETLRRLIQGLVHTIHDSLNNDQSGLSLRFQKTRSLRLKILGKGCENAVGCQKVS